MKTAALMLAFIGAVTAASGANATTQDFAYSLAGTNVATGSFSYANGATGVLSYANLTAFSVTVSGQTYVLSDVTPLTDYIHFAYDTAANVFLLDTNSCGFAGCGFISSLSAINSAGNFGFFFNGAPGAFQEYSTFVGGSFDTITITPANSVPEPATWAMMVGGLAIAGMAMRRRKVAVSFA